ncbi:MAG: hypothetical protein HC866_23085, partial [Leptolyngbyaceae cyanobacterium RU_5_1]|nr:hypothetical protein [Leptolyngbyaceae cyanobacterium RU_5_1]
MTIEEALTILDGVLGHETLNDTQELVFRHAWDDWTYERIAAQFGYAPDHIRNVGAHLWGLLSNVLGEKVTKSNFQSVLRRWAQQHLLPRKQPDLPTHSDRIDLGDAPDASSFTGRRDELATLQQWIVADRCRLVALLGMGGIGKTSLAVVLARQLSGNRQPEDAGTRGRGDAENAGDMGTRRHGDTETEKLTASPRLPLSASSSSLTPSPFQYVVWRSLRNAPPVMDLLVSLIQFLSDGQETDTTVPPDLRGRIQRLMDYLRKHRCLVILDNAESVLPCSNGSNEPDRAGSNYQHQDCEGYVEFLEQLCDLPHQGCVILTSREKPDELAWKEGLTLPVRSLQINGLNQTESQRLFALKGTFSASDAEWQTLVHHYAGNPLALKMVAAIIQELFNNNISEFLTVLGTFVFDDIRDLLDRQFNRLFEVEKEVMYWLAINREVTSFTELRDDVLSPISRQKLPGTLRALKHRFLIETSPTGFTQQPVVMEYVTEKLIEKVGEELRMKNEEWRIQNEELRVERREDFSLLTSHFSLLTSHALLKATAKDYIRDNQARLILQPIAERLQAEMGSKDAIAQHVQTLLSRLRFPQFPSAAPLAPSPQPLAPIPNYGAGNLLNLLCYLDVDLTGFDFSNLAVWQAYLQEVNLHQANFTNADLARSVFFESLAEVWCVAFSPDAHLLAAGDSAGEIHLWRVADHQKLLTLQGHMNWVCSVAFSRTGKMLASGSADGTVKLWNIATGQCIRTLQGQSDWMIAVAFSPDGQTLASCGIDAKTIRLWNVRTGECLKTCRDMTTGSVRFASRPLYRSPLQRSLLHLELT